MRHVESHLQHQCVEWFRLAYRPLARNLIAVPNGGHRNIREAVIMKGEGVMAGASDLVLFAPGENAHALCIEMKTPKGTQTELQKLWQHAVENEGYRYEIVRSFDGFRNLIKDYLKPREQMYDTIF